MATPRKSVTLDDFLTTSEAAAMLGVTRARITILIDEGRFPGAANRGGRWWIPRAAVTGFERLPPVGPGEIASARAKKAWETRRKRAEST